LSKLPTTAIAAADWFRKAEPVHRQQAHKFYFLEGMVVSSFHFGKKLK
jgi:hypothetical protein